LPIIINIDASQHCDERLIACLEAGFIDWPKISTGYNNTLAALSGCL
jgi:hypothetical protein